VQVTLAKVWSQSSGFEYMKTIGILDYGASNLLSVSAALRKIGHNPITIEVSENLERLDALLLPGVGDFSFASRVLNESRMKEEILKFSTQDKTIVGICLGMQLMGTSSTENGINLGLDLIKGETIHLNELNSSKENIRSPKIGWSEVKGLAEITGGSVPDGSEMYFAHSYFMTRLSGYNTFLSSQAGEQEICAGFQRGCLTGLQFHPEKSGELGLSVLKEIFAR
jgi:glutamine amidotransferase